LPLSPASVSEGWSGRRGSNPRPTAWKAVTLPLSYSRLRARELACPRALAPRASAGKPAVFLLPTRHFPLARAKRGRRDAQRCGKRNRGGEAPPHQPSSRVSRASNPFARRTRAGKGWWGGEGSNLRSPKAAGLQPAAIDRSATSPKYITRATCEVRMKPHTTFRARLLWISAPVSSETVGRCPQACTCHWSPRVRCIPEGRRNRPWSWRRDSNPRPADYKSAALPA
jgi:hypothetical protein